MNIFSKYFSKYILSSSPNIGYFTNKKNLLYERQIKKYSEIFPNKKAHFNLKVKGSPFTSRIFQTSRTRIMKKALTNRKIYSINNKNN